jgi:hypothetical protein
MKRITASRLSFHRAGPMCPTSVYVHGDEDGDYGVVVHTVENSEWYSKGQLLWKKAWKRIHCP